jgi:hypothetical protein
VIFNACCCCLKYKYETVQNWLNTKEKGERLMKFYRVVFLVGGLALSAGIASVVAAECGPPSEEERTARQIAIFAQADTDKSNTLSLSEFATFTTLSEAVRAERQFTCLDADGDGQVTAAELAAHRPPHGPHRRGPF